MIRVIVKSKRQLKKMGGERWYGMDGQDVQYYIGAGYSAVSTVCEDTYRLKGLHIHKRFIRKVIKYV